MKSFVIQTALLLSLIMLPMGVNGQNGSKVTPGEKVKIALDQICRKQHVPLDPIVTLTGDEADVFDLFLDIGYTGSIHDSKETVYTLPDKKSTVKFSYSGKTGMIGIFLLDVPEVTVKQINFKKEQKK